MTVVVFGAFLVTNVPYMVQEMILAFGNPGILDHNVVALFGVISASNSAINPYIYLFFQRSQRQCRGFCSALLKDAKNWFLCRCLSNLRSSLSQSSAVTMTSGNLNEDYVMTSLNNGKQVEIRS
uniref:Putative conserved plasma membrane protein n=1 Tax=Ixodes ricinus TaxID=34613 RepID=A0A6B0UNU0_IXORI